MQSKIEKGVTKEIITAFIVVSPFYFWGVNTATSHSIILQPKGKSIIGNKMANPQNKAYHTWIYKMKNTANETTCKTLNIEA